MAGVRKAIEMTKPTRGQQQARALLAQAILAICEAARLDGNVKFSAASLREAIERLAKASSAFSTEEIVLTALEQRLKGLGYSVGSVELLTLVEQPLSTLEMLHLDDEQLKRLVAAAEEEFES